MGSPWQGCLLSCLCSLPHSPFADCCEATACIIPPLSSVGGGVAASSSISSVDVSSSLLLKLSLVVHSQVIDSFLHPTTPFWHVHSFQFRNSIVFNCLVVDPDFEHCSIFQGTKSTAWKLPALSRLSPRWGGSIAASSSISSVDVSSSLLLKSSLVVRSQVFISSSNTSPSDMFTVFNSEIQ